MIPIPRRIAVIAISILALGADVMVSSVRAESCNEPQVSSAVIQKIIAIAQSNPSWLARMQFWVPYFRMKDVQYTVISNTYKGAARTGADCQIVLRMVPPPDVLNVSPVQVTFSFIIMPKPDGGFYIDMY